MDSFNKIDWSLEIWKEGILFIRLTERREMRNSINDDER
jgi:hypothetical protein